MPNWKRAYDITRETTVMVTVNGHPDHFMVKH